MYCLILPKNTFFFGGVPSHIDISGNERADSAAKDGVPYTDSKHCINQYILSTWQDAWNGAVAKKLHSVKPVLGDWQSSYRPCRKDEVVFCVVHIVTHSYILRKDQPPQCEHCQCDLIVRHMLVECNHFSQERKNIFGRSDAV